MGDASGDGIPDAEGAPRGNICFAFQDRIIEFTQTAITQNSGISLVVVQRQQPQKCPREIPVPMGKRDPLIVPTLGYVCAACRGLHCQRNLGHQMRVQCDVNTVKRVGRRRGGRPGLHWHGHGAAKILAIVINVSPAIKNRFFCAADNGDNAGFIDCGRAGHTVGRTKQLNAGQGGLHHTVPCHPLFDDVPDLILLHASEVYQAILRLQSA